MKLSNIIKTAKTARLASAAVLALAGSASAGEVIAPACGFATNVVANGAVDVQSDRVLAADGGTIYKQGGDLSASSGILRLPLYMTPWIDWR